MEMMPWGTKDLTHRSTEIISISLIMLLLLVREKDCPRWGLGVRAGHLEVEIDVDCGKCHRLNKWIIAYSRLCV